MGMAAAEDGEWEGVVWLNDHICYLGLVLVGGFKLQLQTQLQLQFFLPAAGLISKLI